MVLINHAVNLHSLFSQTLSAKIRESLRTRIETAGIPSNMIVKGALIHASVVLPLFYERRVYQPAWSGDTGPFSQVDSLVEAIQNTHLEGLEPEDYHLKNISSILGEIRQNQKMNMPLPSSILVDLDLLCTDAFLIYGSHLLSGRVNPITIHPEWNAKRREADMAKILEETIEKDQIIDSLQNFVWEPRYRRIRQALAQYRNIAAAGRYPLVPPGPKMQKGDRGERIAILHKRLVASGDLPSGFSEDEAYFDEALDQAVRRFQKRHGLDVDGVVGKATLNELNVPVEERIRQLVVNMERWRWLPQSLGRRYILVNIASFELDVVEDDEIVLSMHVVVGKPYRRTPVFSDKMSYLVFSPYWNVPPRIAINDILPEVNKDVSYLKERKIRVYQAWGAEAKEIDPQTIDWSTISAENVPYRFRQDPGPLNALGRVKFMFPNPFGVYLHDTPSRELFVRADRAFSSGCIRVEKPLDLAEYVLRSDSKWTRAAIIGAMEGGFEQTVSLPELVDVYLLYWTAWADEDGTIHFRKDLYGRDRVLYEALVEEPPGR